MVSLWSYLVRLLHYIFKFNIIFRMFYFVIFYINVWQEKIFLLSTCIEIISTSDEE